MLGGQFSIGFGLIFTGGNDVSFFLHLQRFNALEEVLVCDFQTYAHGDCLSFISEEFDCRELSTVLGYTWTNPAGFVKY